MAKKTTKDETKAPSHDVMDEIKSSLGALSKGSVFSKIDYVSNLSEFLMPSGYVSTGDDMADLIISNRANGGLPLTKYINIFGDSQSGKSLLCWKFVASVQRQGGTSIYFDTENSTFPDFVSVLGVDTSNVLGVFQVRSIQKIFLFIINALKIRKRHNDKTPLLIIIDSMKAANLDEKLDDLESFDTKGYDATHRQKVLGDAIEKVLDYIKDENVMFITVDQVRDNLNAKNIYSPKHVDTAGNAQRFYSDIRIQLTTRSFIKIGDEVVGAEIELKTVKNKVAPANRKTKMYVYYTRGLDRWASWIEEGKRLGIFKTKGAYIGIADENGEDLRIDGKLPTQKDIRKLLQTNEPFRNRVYQLFCEKLIIPYEETDDDGFAELDDLKTMEEVKDVPDVMTTSVRMSGNKLVEEDL